MRPHGTYPASGEDEWVAVAVRDAADWDALCRVIDRPALVGKPPPDDADALIAAWTALRAAEECERLLQAARVPAHHVVNGTSVRADDHIAARAMVVPTTFGAQDVLVTSTGYHFATMPAVVGRVARVGEDSIEVLRHHLGYEADRIDGLVATGAVATVAGSFSVNA
jgi:crotonobetainyl-CoA:carnitine CoA-transferase CaiB-like acyl-CoA transferase